MIHEGKNRMKVGKKLNKNRDKRQIGGTYYKNNADDPNL